MLAEAETDEDEQDYLAHGHPALYHAAALGAEVGDEGEGWYEDEEDHVLEVEEGAEQEEAASAAPDTSQAEAPASEPPTSPVPPDLREKRVSTSSVYGEPLDADEAAKLVPAGKGGLVWHAQILADNYTSPKVCRADGTIKPRRPLPHARASDFFSSLASTSDGRWIFNGVLNGWPALVQLELLSVTIKARSRLGRTHIKRTWNAGDKERPAFPPGKGLSGCRVTLRAPSWSAHSFAVDNPGFVFYYKPAGQLAFGHDIIAALGSAPPRRASRVHLLGHRYAKAHESAKDKLVWHCAVLLEWHGGEGISLVELAWWGGLGGYGGKSNWYDDKDAKRPALYAAMPDALKAPWRSNLSEIRFFDLAARDMSEFKAYLTEYSGATKRFFDPTIAHSADVRLSFCSQADIFRYLLNYALNDTHYSEQAKNCQTFAADLFALLSGQHSVEPFSAVNRLMYRRHLDWFLCDPPTLT